MRLHALPIRLARFLKISKFKDIFKDMRKMALNTQSWRINWYGLLKDNLIISFKILNACSL